MHAGCGLLSFKTRCLLIRPITTWQGNSNISNAGLRRAAKFKRSVNEEGAVYEAVVHLYEFQGLPGKSVLLQGSVQALCQPAQVAQHAAEAAEGQRALRRARIAHLQEASDRLNRQAWHCLAWDCADRKTLPSPETSGTKELQVHDHWSLIHKSLTKITCDLERTCCRPNNS